MVLDRIVLSRIFKYVDLPDYTLLCTRVSICIPGYAPVGSSARSYPGRNPGKHGYAIISWVLGAVYPKSIALLA